MTTEIKELIKTIEGVVGELTHLADRPDYWVVKRSIKNIKASAKNFIKTMEWCELVKDCPACGAKPGGCDYCNGIGRVTKQMYDFREKILP